MVAEKTLKMKKKKKKRNSEHTHQRLWEEIARIHGHSYGCIRWGGRLLLWSKHLGWCGLCRSKAFYPWLPHGLLWKSKRRGVEWGSEGFIYMERREGGGRGKVGEGKGSEWGPWVGGMRFDWVGGNDKRFRIRPCLVGKASFYVFAAPPPSVLLLQTICFSCCFSFPPYICDIVLFIFVSLSIYRVLKCCCY